MARDFQVKKRRPVRRKHIAPLLKELEEGLNIDLAGDGAFGCRPRRARPWRWRSISRCPIAPAAARKMPTAAAGALPP
ncbi:MAG: hypothetical protein MKZ54_03545, partial [Candidatus Poseidoniaceae archaeon]|nr:hypothetical protein [Candidatus Poseidoniaceae archaeon]